MQAAGLQPELPAVLAPPSLALPSLLCDPLHLWHTLSLPSPADVWGHLSPCSREARFQSPALRGWESQTPGPGWADPGHSGFRIPLWGGVLITIVDTFFFLFLDNYGRCAVCPSAQTGLHNGAGK